MNVAIINASPRPREHTNSGVFAQELSTLLDTCAGIEPIRLRTSKITAKQIQQIVESDAVVWCFPLYVDHLPSHLMRILLQLEPLFQNGTCASKQYAVVNCGLFEGVQAAPAIAVMQNWCEKAGIPWGQGIGIGGGEMLGRLAQLPLGKGPKKSLGAAMNAISSNILALNSAEPCYINPNFPRFLYKLFAEIGFKTDAKRNGLSVKAMYAAPPSEKPCSNSSS